MIKTNTATLIGSTIGALSYFDVVSAALGTIAVISVIVVNTIAFKTKKSEKAKHDIQAKLAEQQLKNLQDE